MTRETRVKFSIAGFNESSGISIQIDKDGNEIITPALMPTISAKGFDKLTGEEVAGSFTQSPVAGTPISDKEPFDVTVNFVPSNPSKYSSSSKTLKAGFKQAIVKEYGYGFLEIVNQPTSAEIVHSCGAGKIVKQYGQVQVSASFTAIGDFEPQGTISYSPAVGTQIEEDTVVTITWTPDDSTQSDLIEIKVIQQVIQSNKYCQTPEAIWDNGGGVGKAYLYTPACGSDPVEVPYSIGGMGEYQARFVDPLTKEDVDGTITYSPAAGTETYGSFVAQATFTPNDTELYRTASASMSFRVALNNSSVKCGFKIFGCEIISIKSSIGWGQGGSCQISAIFEKSHKGEKPHIPALGTPCIAGIEGFSFGGILQRWTYKQSVDGLLYDFIIAAPLKVIDSVDVILSSFDGHYFNQDADKYKPYNNELIDNTKVKNIWNAFAEKENFNIGGTWGGSDVNSAGYPALALLEQLEKFSRGEGKFGDKIKYGDSVEEFTFELDLGELKNVPEYFRISGQSMKLSNIISECADILQYDYYATLKEKFPATPAEGEEVEAVRAMSNPVISIVTLDKGDGAASGVVERLVEESKQTGALISASNGVELSDEVTNRMVVGGPASRYFVSHITKAFPVWGKLGPNNYIISGANENVPAAYNNPNSIVSIYLDPLSQIGVNGGVTRTFRLLTSPIYYATIEELRMATGGFESWAMYKTFQSFARGTYDVDPWCSMVDITPQALAQVANGVAGPMTFASTSAKTGQKMYDEELKEGVQKLFELIQRVATESYGKVFLVELEGEPGGAPNNVKYISEDQRHELSWEYTDAAWTSIKPVSDIDFYDASGRLKTTALFDIRPNWDYSDMGNQYASWGADISGPQIATTKCTNMDKALWFNQYGKPYIAMEISAQVKEYDQWTTQEYGLTFLAQRFFGVYLDPRLYTKAGKQNTQVVIPPNIVYPSWIGVPQISNRYSWGPWYKSSQETGKAEVVFDTNMVPENFGTSEELNTAAEAAAGAGIAKMKEHESGNVELAELPRCGIADRINGTGPYVTNMSVEASTNGFKTSYEFNTWTPNFGRLAKYNADRIQRIYKARLDALNRFSQDNPKQPIQPFRFKEFGFDHMSNRSNLNRTSAGFSLFNLFQNYKAQGDQVNISDAIGLSLNDLENSFGVSEDGKWSPVGTSSSKSSNQGGVYISAPANITEEQNGPYLSQSFPNSRTLDPFFCEMGGQSPNQAIQKADILAANNSSNGETVDLQIEKANTESVVDTVRAVGLRGPMLLSGFGIDVAGNPVPSNGTNITQPASNVQNRGSWKTGPVNLMWDNERCVWSGGLEMLCGVLASDIEAAASPLSPTTFTVNVLRKNANTKGDGALATLGESLTCFNRDPSLSQAAGDDVFVIVVRINYEWTPLWVSCP